jgi:hypothetical protein
MKYPPFLEIKNRIYPFILLYGGVNVYLGGVFLYKHMVVLRWFPEK